MGTVDFAYVLQDGDRVSVYPVFESLNIENVTRLRKVPLRKTKFIADIHLGDIVKYMRALGFDVCFDPSLSTRKIIEISKKKSRIILTKSRQLLKFKEVTHAILENGVASLNLTFCTYYPYKASWRGH